MPPPASSIAAVARWRRTEVVLIYLAVGAVAALGYELALLQGDPGVGKSSLATRLARHLGAELLQVQRARGRGDEGRAFDDAQAGQ